MGCELYFMLTLTKKDISSLFTVFKARLKRGTADTRPGQLKDLLLRQSIFHKPLQEPALSDTSPISIIHYRGTDSEAYICVCMNVRVEEVLFMQQMLHRFIFHHFRPLQPISRTGE